MDAPTPNPSQILQVGTGFFASRALLSAVELNLFGTLAAGPLELATLRARLGLHERAAADFLDALVALGFLRRDGDGAGARYANTTDTAAFLDPASPAYLGGLLIMAANRLYPFWGRLTEALRTGQPQNETRDGDPDVFATLYADPSRLEEFLGAMAGVQQGNFLTLAERFDFGPFKTVCDIGGAGAALCMAIARRHPGCRAFRSICRRRRRSRAATLPAPDWRKVSRLVPAIFSTATCRAPIC